jgi:hypothetical protein
MKKGEQKATERDRTDPVEAQPNLNRCVRRERCVMLSFVA